MMKMKLLEKLIDQLLAMPDESSPEGETDVSADLNSGDDDSGLAMALDAKKVVGHPSESEMDPNEDDELAMMKGKKGFM